MKRTVIKTILVTAVFQVVLLTAAVAIPGDADGNGSVGVEDLIRLADWWTIDICDITMFENCNGADMTGPNGTPDGVVDLYDFALLADAWVSAGASS